MTLWSAMAITLLLSVSVLAGDSPSFRFDRLIGDWEGEGEIVVPMTETSLEVEGTASFTLDTATGLIRSRVSGQKYLMTYSDTGYIHHDPATDSVTWEVWDNFRKHRTFRGIVANGILKGTRTSKRGVYDVRVSFTDTDRIKFHLTLTKPNGKTVDRAVLELRRVKK